MNENKPYSEMERLIRAFRNSWHGLRFAASHPAFRIEMIAAALMIPLACVLGESGLEKAMLIGSVLLVLIVELLNTGIERAIDRISPEWHELSKQAKDVGSAAVLLALIHAGVIWLLLVVV
jgi:diacylglycerol kinase (ATP)